MQHNLQRILDIIMDGLLSIASTNTSLKENDENDGCGDSGGEARRGINSVECA